jgi:tRNA1Val (adenine37-N6)-methyltransferase
MVNETTVDAICRGEILAEQPRFGYRFNVDSVILAHFVSTFIQEHGPEVVDLGAGCGIIGLLLAKRWPNAHVVLVEIQEELALLASRNIQHNNLESRVEVCFKDLRAAENWSGVLPSLVVCNPPYYPVHSGQQSPNVQIASARHEIHCTLNELLLAVETGLPRGGHFAIVYAYSRLNELLAGMKAHAICPAAIQRIIPSVNRPCSRILLWGIRGGSQAPLRELEDLVIWRASGVYSEEMSRMLGDKSGENDK